MLKIDFDEFLLLDERKFDDFQIAFHYIKNYIKIFRTSLSIDDIEDLSGLIDKFIQFAGPEIDSNSLDLDTSKLVNNAYDYVRKASSEKEVQKAYQDFYSNFLSTYNKILFYFRQTDFEVGYLNFDGLISYEISNKRTAISLIQEAIELVKTDKCISKKSKDKIVEYLADVINELLNPKSNWKNIWSKVSEIILVLGALGAIICSVEAGNNLLAAKSKLKNAKDTMIKTSINLNYQNLEQTFVINKNIAIENNQLTLPETTE